MIQGYPDRPSVLPGGTLTFHVSTDAPRFRVDFYRQGQTLVFMGNLGGGWMVGQNVPQGRPNQDWRWPDYAFPIPGDWPSGAYIAMFIEGDANGNQISSPDTSKADGQDAKALFVVKSTAPGTSVSILYKLPLFTYHAYNYTGGGSLYEGSNSVTLHRPGGGTGGKTTEFGPGNEGHIDVYDQSSLRQTFAHWDVPFIVWLEKNGYQVDYCTDLDIHEDRNLDLLRPYKLLLSVGHDEYWSEDMRTHVETFIQNGGNVAFFSGNTCWWHIVFDDAITFRNTARWWELNNPENSLTGVSYRDGGGWYFREREAVGYTVQHAEHWVYTGTGLSNNGTFGSNEHLVGYECDGVGDGTPSNFLILGVGKLHGWQDTPSGKATATMGIYSRNGIVFTAATTDWARVLANDEPHVEQTTRNVLNRLRTNVHSLRQFLQAKGVTSVRPLQPTGSISVRSLLGLW